MFWLAVFWQATDLGSFIWMMSNEGLRAEVNPITHMLASITGDGAAITTLIAIKVALIAYLIWLYGTIAGRPRLRTTVLSLAIIAGLIGGLSNLLTL